MNDGIPLSVRHYSQYIVSEGTSLPEVFFDFWKAVSAAIDEHRATRENRSFRKVLMFVAPFCEVQHFFFFFETTTDFLDVILFLG